MYKNYYIRVMRLITLLLFSTFLQLSASSYSQTVTLSARDMRLVELCKAVREQTGYRIVGNNELLKNSTPITIYAEQMPLEDFLNRALRDQPIRYRLEGKTIFLLALKDADGRGEESPGVSNGPGTQRRNIRGKVADAEGKPISGVTVTIKGTSRSAITEMDGTFNISLSPGETSLLFSAMGYTSTEAEVGSTETIQVVMQQQIDNLDEVQVVGYGTQRKTDVTGSVSSIKGSELTVAPNNNIAQALQGRVAGVMIQNNSGGPVGGITVRIRGANSLTYGNDPLIIIDGVQGGNIGNLNPTEVESVDVLKDAAALSVYGSRGANGVIVITTKSGISGKPAINYNAFVSVDEVRRELPAMNATDYAQLVNDARAEFGQQPLFSEGQLAGMGAGTNWQDAIFRRGLTNNHNLSIGGSTERMSYFLAGGYANREGIILNTDYRQFTLRPNFKIQATPKLSFTINSFVSYDLAHQGDPGGALNSALQWSPTKQIYDGVDGKYTQPGGGIGPVSIYNPVGLAQEPVQDNKNTAWNISPTALYQFNDNFSLSSQLAYKLNSTFSGYFDNQVVGNGLDENINGGVSQGRTVSLQNTNIINYKKQVADHNFEFTGVYEFIRSQFVGTSVSANGVPVGLGYNGLSFGRTFFPPGNNISNSAMQSFMGRINYNYKSRYLFSVANRYDGASQLAEGNKYENFSAVSAGWNLMEEPFMQAARPTLSVLKIRASYGVVGNAAVPSYASQQMFSSGLDANNEPVLSLRQLANPNLRWERTAEKNIGLDATLFNGKLDFTAEYYDKHTSDLLMWQQVPVALGVPSILTNVGAVSNKGVDLSLGGTAVSNSSFTWKTMFTMNYNANKILALDGLSDTLRYASSGDMPGVVGSFVQIVGQPMSTFLGFEYVGVWQQSEVSTAAIYGSKPGDAKYNDLNQDGVIDREDITIIGNGQAKFTLGWQNTWNYKNFDLSILLQGVTGNQIYNQNRIRREAYTSDAFPLSPEIKNHWTPTNPSPDIPSFSGFESLNSSRWVEDGSYLRVKNIVLGYRFPERLLSATKSLSALRLYVSTTNLFTFTDYTGFDPEASLGADTDGGVDRGVYPSHKTFIIGLDLKF